jgi:prevent-host-death family protein
MNVGVRALRNSLSRHLADVRSGHVLTVTDRGVPVAQIVPVGTPTALERLVEEGRVHPARVAKRRAPKPVAVSGLVSDLLSDQRG